MPPISNDWPFEFIDPLQDIIDERYMRGEMGGCGDKWWLDDPEEYARLGNTIEERAEAYRTYMSIGLDRSEETMIDTAVRRCRLTGSVRFVREVYREYGVLGINRGPGRPRKRRKMPDS